MSRLRVPVGFAVGLLVLILARPQPLWVLAGLPLLLLGETIRLWASGHIEKTERLATGGPYAHSRNPLYVGSVLLAMGTAIASASPWSALAVAAYFAVFYPPVIREEAAFLQKKFGAAYDTWAKDVPAFFPRPAPGGPRESAFSWARVARNREWRTLATLPALLVLLWLRGRLF